MKKWLIVLLTGLLSLGVVMGGLTTASAETPSGDPDAVLDSQPPSGEPAVGNTDEPLASGRGIGYLVAHGAGAAGLEGIGRVYAEGRGKLFVKDIAGDARTDVRGFGRSTHYRNGWTKYEGAGQARIAGSHVKVVVIGDHLTLGARGKGRFVLRGTGRFDTNGVQGSWPAHGAYST